MKKLFAVLTVAMTALALSGCGMFEKKADPNFGLQLQAYKEAVAAKQSTEKAKADRKPVQVLTIKGQGDKPIIMSGISEITVNLPTELFEKGGSAPAEQVTMPSLPVEQPNFLERTADKVLTGFIASIPVLGQTYVQVNGQNQATKQTESTNQMWTNILTHYQPTVTTTTTTNTSRSNNSGGNVGDSAGDNRGNTSTLTSGNSGQNSGDNRGNTDNSGDNRSNVPAPTPTTPTTPTCTPTPPATHC
jgi:hypothetical protein